jgi:hypothetical protein
MEDRFSSQFLSSLLCLNDIGTISFNYCVSSNVLTFIFYTQIRVKSKGIKPGRNKKDVAYEKWGLTSLPNIRWLNA